LVVAEVVHLMVVMHLMLAELVDLAELVQVDLVALLLETELLIKVVQAVQQTSLIAVRQAEAAVQVQKVAQQT
jgi:hypothetical protein